MSGMEQSNVTVTEDGTPEGHDERMAAVARGETPEETTEERLLAGKFKSPEDLEKAYTELQKKFSSTRPQEEPEGSEEETTTSNDESASSDDLSIDDAQEAVEEAGLDFDKYNTEFSEEGKLSDSSYEELESKGFSKDMVDTYVRGLKAEIESQTSAIDTIAGGREQLDVMRKWASSNMDADQKKSFNDLVGSGDIGKVKTAIVALKSLYQEANGTEANLLGGKTQAASTGYNSLAEMQDDINNERYARDDAFRAKAEAKARNSSHLFR